MFLFMYFKRHNGFKYKSGGDNRVHKILFRRGRGGTEIRDPVT